MTVAIVVGCYIVFGVVYDLIRLWLINHGYTWSIIRLLDEIDGMTEDTDRAHARRNCWWFWAFWPPFFILDALFFCVALLYITLSGGLFYVLFGDKQDRRAAR